MRKLATFLAGNRKFLITGSVLLTCTCLIVLKYISAENFGDIVKVVVTAYLGSNIGEHAISMFKAKTEKK